MNAELHTKLLRLYCLEKALVGLNPKTHNIDWLKLETDCDNLMEDINRYSEVISESHKVIKEYTLE